MDDMLWLRKGIVHLLALVLLISLLGIAALVSLNHTFASPNKLENWLAESKIYDQIIPSALSNAEIASAQDGSEGSVSLNDPGIQQAANQAFTPADIEQDVNSVLMSNYAWLKGQTATPEFSINLSSAKQSFASNVGQLVEKHLASVPACTATQLSQLQFPVDPLTVSCLPPTLNPTTEGQEITQDVNSGDFLSKPVITASNLSQSSQPYYKRASWVPSLFRLSQKLPYILALVSLVIALGIVFIAPSKRRGIRRIGVVLLLAGAILLAITLLANTTVNKIENKTFTQTLNNQLQLPYHQVLHQIEASLVQSDRLLGIVYIVIAVIIFIALIFTRHRKHSNRPKGTLVDSSPESQSLDPHEDLSAGQSLDRSPRRGAKQALQPLSYLQGLSVSRRREAMPTAPTVPKSTPARRPPRHKRPKLIQ